MVLVIDLLPYGLPVAGLFGMPLDHVANRLGILASGRDAGEPRLDQLLRIVLEKGFRIHPRHELATVEPVAVVHQPSELLSQLDSHIRHAGRDQPGEVGFNLVVNVIGVRIELRVPRIGRRNSVAEVLAAKLVGVPEPVAAVGEVDARLANGDVQAVEFHRTQEGHLNVDVVLPILIHHLRFPDRNLFFGDDHALELEFRWCAPTDPHHLADPAGRHLVAVLLD